MQEYMMDGDRNTNVFKVINKARGRTLDIKLHQLLYCAVAVRLVKNLVKKC